MRSQVRDLMSANDRLATSLLSLRGSASERALDASALGAEELSRPGAVGGGFWAPAAPRVGAASDGVPVHGHGRTDRPGRPQASSSTQTQISQATANVGVQVAILRPGRAPSIVEMQARLKEAQSQAQEERAAAAALRAEHQRHKKDSEADRLRKVALLADLRQTVANKDAELQRQAKLNGATESKLAALETKRRVDMATVPNLRRKIKEQEQELVMVNALKVQLNETQARLNVSSEKLSSKSHRLDLTRQRCSELSASLSAVNDQLNESVAAEDENKRLRRDAKKLEARLKKAAADSAEGKGALQNKADELERLQNQCQRLRARAAAGKDARPIAMATQTEDSGLGGTSSVSGASTPCDPGAVRHAQDILNLTDLEFAALISHKT